MTKRFIFTLTGPDQVGIVKRITQIILEFSGNVEASKMARLGGEFTMLMLVACPGNQFEGLKQQLVQLEQDGFQVLVCLSSDEKKQNYEGWLPYQIKVHGADHEGIVHRITQALSNHNINIETMDTSIIHAPMSGTPLFSMLAIVIVPPSLSFQLWRKTLDAISYETNINIEIGPYTGS